MVDEAHERSLNIDFTLGLLKRMQSARKEAGLPPVKIIVTSATLEKEKFAKFFDDAPVIEVPGRLHQVQIHFESDSVRDYPKAAAERAKVILQSSNKGDILIFVPGKEEISKTQDEIQRLKLDATILPLYGAMSPEDQDKIFEEGGQRKIIVSTNIAETSVTVPGVKFVIDTGQIKQVEYDSRSGITSLEARQHSKSGCIQRSGRAGRISAGECFRLYTRDDFESRQEHQTPEIQRSNLAQVVLSMIKMGIKDVTSFEFIDPPGDESVYKAIEELQILGALDQDINLTQIGEIMADLPLEPHVARMVIEAEKHGCVEQICTIAALMSMKSVFVRPKDKEAEADSKHLKFKVSESDFLTLLKVWSEYENSNFNSNWARDNFLNSKALGEVKQIRHQLFEALSKNGVSITENADPVALGKCITAGLIQNLMESGMRHSYYRVRGDWSSFYIHPSSSVFGSGPSFLVAADLVTTSKTYMRLVQRVKLEWLPEVAPQILTENLGEITYDPIDDQVSQEVLIGFKGRNDVFLSQKRQIHGKKAAEVFALALSKIITDLDFQRYNRNLLNELTDLWLRSGNSELDPERMKNELARFYMDRLGSISTKQELIKALDEKGINLDLNTNSLISDQERERILKENPDSLTIDGNDYKITYYVNSGYGFRRFQDPQIQIPVHEFALLKEIPTLRGGRQLEVQIVTDSGSTYSISVGSNIDEAKKVAHEMLVKQQFDNWKFEPGSPKDRDIHTRIDTENLPGLPEPIVYGTDELTGEPLIAFAALTLVETYGANRYSIKYYPSKDEANIAQSRAVDSLEKSIEDEKRELDSGASSDRLRVDDYNDMSKLSISDLRQILINDKTRDVGKWRLAVSRLAVLGTEGVEELVSAKVTDMDSLDAVQKAIKKMVSDASSKRRGDYYSLNMMESDASKAIEIYRRVVAANQHPLVKDFLGKDKDVLQKFRRMFYERLSQSLRLPDLNSLGADIDVVLERMTS